MKGEWKLKGSDVTYEPILDGKVLVGDDGNLYRAQTPLVPGAVWVQKMKCSVEKSSGNLRTTINIDKVRHTLRPYRLVAEFFVPNPDGLKNITFKDGDRTNTHPDNLVWCKPATKGRKRTCQTLPEDTRKEVVQMYSNSKSRSEIAEALGLKYNTVCALIKRAPKEQA